MLKILTDKDFEGITDVGMIKSDSDKPIYNILSDITKYYSISLYDLTGIKGLGDVVIRFICIAEFGKLWIVKQDLPPELLGIGKDIANELHDSEILGDPSRVREALREIISIEPRETSGRKEGWNCTGTRLTVLTDLNFCRLRDRYTLLSWKINIEGSYRVTWLGQELVADIQKDPTEGYRFVYYYNDKDIKEYKLLVETVKTIYVLKQFGIETIGS